MVVYCWERRVERAAISEAYVGRAESSDSERRGAKSMLLPVEVDRRC